MRRACPLSASVAASASGPGADRRDLAKFAPPIFSSSLQFVALTSRMPTDGALAPGADHFALLQHVAVELERIRQVADLVQEQGAAVAYDLPGRPSGCGGDPSRTRPNSSI